jgi:hypothetical protein
MGDKLLRDAEGIAVDFAGRRDGGDNVMVGRAVDDGGVGEIEIGAGDGADLSEGAGGGGGAFHEIVRGAGGAPPVEGHAILAPEAAQAGGSWVGDGDVAGEGEGSEAEPVDLGGMDGGVRRGFGAGDADGEFAPRRLDAFHAGVMVVDEFELVVLAEAAGDA